MGKMGIEGGGVDGSGGTVDEREELLGQELVMEDVGTVFDESGGS